MATIPSSGAGSILSIREFLGLNENPDGDTKIKTGELSEAENFRITRDKHLQLRPGTRTVVDLRAAWDDWAAQHATSVTSPRFCGAWEGMVGQHHHVLAAFGGLIFDVQPDAGGAAVIGTATEDDTSFFGFSGKVYLLNGHEYKTWDGSGEFTDVEGYVPLTVVSCTPQGTGTLLENVNRLNGKRRVRYSPDGEAAQFRLPESEVSEILSVEGTDIPWSADFSGGTITFDSAPEKGINTVTVAYRKGNGSPSDVRGMRFAELFNGQTDTRVFLYGDGSNRTIYSGLDGNGIPSAEYFPDLYEASVGEANTPITGLVRHHAQLLAFKTGSTWSIQYGTQSLAGGAVTAAFYVVPINRQFGNEAMGQVRLLENDPITLDGGNIYQWKATSSTGNINTSETNARRISDRVSATVGAFPMGEVRTFNCRSSREYYFLHGGAALIYNYANDTWYKYTAFPCACLLELEGTLYGFRPNGAVFRMSRSYRSDDGADIHARAATGSMDFGRDWQLKYSPYVFVSLLPESNARIDVTVETDKRGGYPEKTVAVSLSTFQHVDFNHFSFRTSRKPQTKRLKLKVKKANFYKLIYKSDSSSATATVLQTDVQLRYAGSVK